jgi:hypothetical protein
LHVSCRQEYSPAAGRFRRADANQEGELCGDGAGRRRFRAPGPAPAPGDIAIERAPTQIYVTDQFGWLAFQLNRLRGADDQAANEAMLREYQRRRKAMGVQ